MSLPENPKEIINLLKTKTKENIQTLTDKGDIYTNDKLAKNYIQNHSVEHSLGSNKKAIPINIIYHCLYDQDNLCQSSKGKLNYQRNIFSERNDYDIKFDKKTFDNKLTPKYFNKPLAQCVKSFIENKSIKEDIDDLDNYPKIFEFQYNYQHPLPNPVFLGPKLLENTDNYKIIFISPICLIVEEKNVCAGFSGVDCFYSAIRFKFDMELNDDLTVKKTILNCYFGINFIKSSWLQGKISSNAYEQAEDGFTNKYLPAINKEFNLTIKKYSNDNNKNKKIGFKKEKTFNPDKNLILDDLIINDSFISDSEEEKKKNIKKTENNLNIGNIKNIFNIILILSGIIIGVFFLRSMDKEFLIIILLGMILYNLILINSKLNKLAKEKNE